MITKGEDKLSDQLHLQTIVTSMAPSSIETVLEEKKDIINTKCVGTSIDYDLSPSNTVFETPAKVTRSAHHDTQGDDNETTGEKGRLVDSIAKNDRNVFKNMKDQPIPTDLHLVSFQSKDTIKDPQSTQNPEKLCNIENCTLS